MASCNETNRFPKNMFTALCTVTVHSNKARLDARSWGVRAYLLFRIDLYLVLHVSQGIVSAKSAYHARTVFWSICRGL